MGFRTERAARAALVSLCALVTAGGSDAWAQGGGVPPLPEVAFPAENPFSEAKRVLGKLDDNAPHETLLVIDANNGQNALAQARQFHEDIGLTGVCITKLDGSAKGGILLAIARELGVPIRFIGIGEQAGDLAVFDAEQYVDALLDQAVAPT